MRILKVGNDIKAAKPKPTEMPPVGYMYAYDSVTDSWDLVKKTIAYIDHVNMLSIPEFMDRLHPNRPNDVGYGSTVFVQSAQVVGKVIRVKDNIFRVEANDKTLSCWKQELIPLAS